VDHFTGQPFPVLKTSGSLTVITTYSCGAARDFHPLPYSPAWTKNTAGTRTVYFIFGSAVVAEAGKKSNPLGSVVGPLPDPLPDLP